MSAPQKAIPKLAANRLARWALMLNEYNYSIEYRETKEHGNADALCCLPVGPDTTFDKEESDADVDTICMIKTISMQIKPINSKGFSQRNIQRSSACKCYALCKGRMAFKITYR